MSIRSKLHRLTPFFAVVTLPAGILAGIFAGLQTALVVFVVGWLLLVPATAVLFPNPMGPGRDISEEVNEAVQEEMNQSVRQAGARNEESGDPIEELRQRYARGEIDERELERGLEALLETEGVDAEDEDEIERTIDRLEDGESELLTEEY